MKSGKQRRAEIDARREKRTDQAAAARAEEARAAWAVRAGDGLPVDPQALAPNNSYGPQPCPAVNGFYFDLPFACVECGKEETWTAAQQKWWYEVAKGAVYSTARRCRACRRRERARRNRARRVHREGLARKQASRQQEDDGAQ